MTPIFGCRNSNQHLNSFFEKFYTETFFPYLIENKINTVIQFGDIFDSRKYSNHVAVDDAKRYFFDKFSDHGIKLITLLGNHDIAHKESLSVSSSELFLSNLKNITIIKEPTVLIKNGISIDLIPWICKENYDSCISFVKNSNSELCIGHFEFSGFKMHKTGISSEHGLSAKLFSNYEKVLSGHFHHRSKKGNVEYIGTPYEMTWSDYDDQKGFYVFDTKTRGMEFVPNPHSIYIKEEYDDTIENSDVTNSSYLKEEYLNKFKDKYVKIQVKNKSNPYLFDLFLDKVYAQNTIDVTIIEEIVEFENEDVVDESDDTLTITYNYIDSINQEDLDKSRLKLIMANLYSDAMEIE